MWQKYFQNIEDIEILENESIKNYTTMRVGGVIKCLIISHSTQSLIRVCKICKLHNIKYKTIGQGANLIFSDNTYNGVVIVNRSSDINIDNNSILADSGVSMSNIISVTKSNNLSGLESLAGIPSTIGGAMVNNLGAFGTEIGDLVEYVECYNAEDLLTKLTFSQKECKFGYRTSIFQSNNFIITKVKLNLSTQQKSKIEDNIKYALNKKTSTQPLDLPSAGSIFKRIDNLIPAKIIDELKLKGTTIGGAMISTKHAGFIVNINNATSHDIFRLIELIQDKVFDEYKVRFPLEVEFVDY